MECSTCSINVKKREKFCGRVSSPRVSYSYTHNKSGNPMHESECWHVEGLDRHLSKRANTHRRCILWPRWTTQELVNSGWRRKASGQSQRFQKRGLVLVKTAFLFCKQCCSVLSWNLDPSSCNYKIYKMPAVPRMRIVIIVPIWSVFIFFFYLDHKSASIHAVSRMTTCYRLDSKNAFFSQAIVFWAKRHSKISLNLPHPSILVLQRYPLKKKKKALTAASHFPLVGIVRNYTCPQVLQTLHQR